MEILAKIVFAIYACVIAAGGIMAVLSKNLVRALIGLILTLFGVAGMYLLMSAPVVAFMQLLIYVGAVSILIFLAIMLVRTGPEGDESKSASSRKFWHALLGFASPAVIIGTTILRHPVESSVIPASVTVNELGKGFFGPYELAFELISLVLLIAMAGAVLLAFEKRGIK